MTYPIPDAALSEHIAFLGSTGAGKTWAAKTAVERLFGQAPICVIDPTGAWWGLRRSRDAEFAGLDFLILGGDHGDVPLTEHDGEAVAGIIHEAAMNTIVDVSAMMLSEQRRFITTFAEHIFRLNRKPLHLVIDEADSFMPQKPMRDQTMMLNRMDRLVRRGRSRGFRIMLLSQRPAVLNKDSLSQVGTLVAMRLRSPQDRAAIGLWIEGQADKKKGKEIVDGLPEMKRGEGWVWSPGHDVLDRVKFPEIMTFDSSADSISAKIHLGQWPSEDLEEVRRRLGIDDDEEEPTTTMPTDVTPRVPITDAKAAFDQGFAQGFKEGLAAAWVNVRQAVNKLAVDIDTFQKDAQSQITVLAHALQHHESLYMVPGSDKIAVNAVPAADAGIKVADHFTSTHAHFERRATAPEKIEGVPSSTLLVAAVRHLPARLTWGQLATLCGRKARGGHFNGEKKRLLDGGFITEEGDVAIPTQKAIDAVGAPERRGSLLDAFQEALPEPANKMFRIIRSRRNVTAAVLADELSMKPTGGHWNSGMSTLVRCNLVRKEGEIILLNKVA